MNLHSNSQHTAILVVKSSVISFYPYLSYVCAHPCFMPLIRFSLFVHIFPQFFCCCIFGVGLPNPIVHNFPYIDRIWAFNEYVFYL